MSIKYMISNICLSFSDGSLEGQPTIKDNWSSSLSDIFRNLMQLDLKPEVWKDWSHYYPCIMQVHCTEWQYENFKIVARLLYQCSNYFCNMPTRNWKRLLLLLLFFVVVFTFFYICGVAVLFFFFSCIVNEWVKRG